MPIPNTTEVSAPIATSTLGDNYNTHFEEMGEGGYRSVADVPARDAIPALRRKEGMLVCTLSTSEIWQLGAGLTNIDWVLFSAGSGVIIILTGDVTGSGSSPIATTLANSGVVAGTYSASPAQKPLLTVDSKGRITSATNQNIVIPESAVTNLIADLASKVPNSALGVTVATLVAGTVPLAQLPFSATSFLGLWDAFANTPVLSDATGNVGEFYICNVSGTQNLGSGVVNWLAGYVVVHDGTIWQQANLFTGAAIQNIITDSGTLNGSTVTLDSTAQIADSAGRRYVTDDEKDGLDNALTLITAANPVVSQADLNFSVFNYINSWNAATNTPVLADGVGTAGDAYMIGVGGTQNLGSGAITFATNDAVIYNGAVWQKFTNVGVGVFSWNGLSGIVVVTTAQLPDSAGRRYVSDAFLAAMTAASAPSGANPFATIADLNFGFINYINSWNAFTNFPVLADGTGTLGDAYIVGVAGTQNLGSGAITFAVNDAVIHNGTVWQKFPNLGVGVSSWNGLTGVVNVTTAQLPPSLNRQYQTDIQLAIQNAAVAAGASAINRYATLADLGAVVVGTQWLTPESVAVGYTLGNGTAQTFAGAGKTLGQAQADFPLVPITSTNDLVDWAAIYQASMLMNNATRQNEVQLGCFGARDYIINKAIAIPKSIAKTDPCRFDFRGHGCLIRTTSTTLDIFSSLPVDQSEAVNVCAHTLVGISNMTLSAISATAKGSGQSAIKLGGRGVILEDILVANFDAGIDLQFCLMAQVNNCSATGFQTTGYRFRPGTWSGASPTNAAANGTVVNNCRSNPIQGTDYGMWFQGGSDTTVNSCVIEGTPAGVLTNSPKAGIFYDSLNATTSLGTFQIHGLYHEQFYTDACVHIKGRSGVYLISDMSNQDQGLDAVNCRNIVKLESYAGFMYFQLERFGHFTPNYQFYLGGSNCLPIFMECPSSTAAIFNNAARWSNFQPSLAILQQSIYPP